MKLPNRIASGFFALMTVLFPAHGRAASTDESTDERALLRLEQEWINAESHHDAAALQAILDDRFIATFGTSKSVDKEAFIAEETKGAPDPTVCQQLSDRQVIIADRTAVIVETDTLHRIKDNKPSTATWRFTVTYIKRGDRWLALAEQGGPTSP